jgi:TatD DNase family protein
MGAYTELAKQSSVVAIGECGLDYFRLPESEVESQKLKVRQKDTFMEHCKLAQEVGKPLMVHARPSKGSQDAYEDVLEILKEFRGIKANFHFFVGNIEIAKKIIALGLTMSFDGPITFSRDYDELIKFLPIESIMCETDAPFAAPVPYRGKECEPWMVEEVYKKIAEIKNLPNDVIIEQINKNVAIFTKQTNL